MASVSASDTKPEVIIRKSLFAQGFRFRKNVKILPGKPDIVLRKYKTVIFVHGCFWHGHRCKRGKRPTSNKIFWDIKIQANIKRDKVVRKHLNDLGWDIITIWGCEISSIRKLESTINKVIRILRRKTI